MINDYLSIHLNVKENIRENVLNCASQFQINHCRYHFIILLVDYPLRISKHKLHQSYVYTSEAQKYH